ncbi:iron assimilation by reduction and transport [Homalodisca vitripennis]|nr:iron assimilation by reduction and transport [Homalodisca vitripennis]
MLKCSETTFSHTQANTSLSPPVPINILGSRLDVLIHPCNGVQYLDTLDFSHPCVRECIYGANMVCYYTFIVDWYTSMSVQCGDCPFNTTPCSNPGCIVGGGIVYPVVFTDCRIHGPAISVRMFVWNRFQPSLCERMYLWSQYGLLLHIHSGLVHQHECAVWRLSFQHYSLLQSWLYRGWWHRASCDLCQP